MSFFICIFFVGHCLASRASFLRNLQSKETHSEAESKIGAAMLPKLSCNNKVKEKNPFFHSLFRNPSMH
jgi:hypothetical protein